MSQDLSDFFKLLAEEKKQKKAEFDSIVGDLNLNNIFDEVSNLKKIEKKKKLEEQKKIEKKKKKEENELKGLVGEITLDTLFEEVKIIKKVSKEKEKKKKEKEKKALQAFENFLYNDKVTETEEVQEAVEDWIQEVVEEDYIQEETQEFIQEVIEEPIPEIVNDIEEPDKNGEIVEKSLGLLSEPSDIKQQNDPLTPLDKNFATLDDLNNHYKLFLTRIQQQLSTLGGGGETRLEFLDDVDRNSAKVNGRYLKYDSTSGKWIGATAGGSGSQTLDDTLLLGNTSSLGMSVGVITATSFNGNATSATYATTAGVSTTSGYSTTAGVSTYATTAGIATYATTAGVSTSVIGGIGSITQLRVSGVSTLGIATFTGAVSFGTSAYFGTNDNLVLGNNNNLQLYYNGSNSLIDASVGLILKSTSTTYQGDAHTFQNSDQTKTYATFISSGSAFYQNNNTKLEIIGAGITVTGTTFTNSLRVSGVTTSTGGFVGDLTGNASSATYATTAGVSTYATTAGIATYATTAGVSTYATTAGVSTSVIGGISSVTQLQVTGVSTFTNGPVLVGSGTSTGTASQRLQVTGGGYFSGNVGIGTTLSNEALSVFPKIQILNNSNADGRLILRAKPGNAYRWNIDNDGDTNNLRFFKEDDATAANGAAPFVITPTGNATLSGNLNAAGNYYVKLARTSNQTINNGSDTLIGFSAISDGNSWFNSGNNRITPTVAGNYCINAMVKWEAGAATNTVQSNIQIRRNGTTIALSVFGVQTHTYTMNINAIVTMNGSTDYIEFTVYTGNPTSQVVGGDAGGTLTKLELFKLN